MDQSVYIKFDDVEMKSWEIIKCHTCAAVKLRKKIRFQIVVAKNDKG